MGWSLMLSGPKAEVIAQVEERDLDDNSPSREQFLVAKVAILAELAACPDDVVAVSCYGNVEGQRRILSISVG
jgi:hypothetical protein